MNAASLRKLIAVVVVAAAALTGATADAATIHGRERHQQARIAQGIRSGQLTPREAARLEGREAGLRAQEDHMRANHGGALTVRDRAVLRCEHDRLSGAIWRQKHDGQHR
jgi:hypothetical protein